MPTRNIVKEYGEDCYYHVYNRGVDRMPIYRDQQDYVYFRNLFKRFLSPGYDSDKYGRTTRKYDDKLELVAYCLMPNHFHMLIYLREADGLKLFMQSAMTAYSMYFNKKYKRTGGLFQNTFLASPISQDYYLWHVSRYIHLNPVDLGENFDTYIHSSIANFIGKQSDDWLHSERLVETKAEQHQYAHFVADHQSMHQDLHLLKQQLAN
jgi:putative transposase